MKQFGQANYKATDFTAVVFWCVRQKKGVAICL